MIKNIFIAVFGIVSVLALIDGHLQRQRADNLLELAERYAVQTQYASARVEQALQEAMIQRQIAQQHMVLIEEMKRKPTR